MALTSTMFTFDVTLSDVDRAVYATIALRMAQHPSESEEYFVTRLLAYCLEYEEGIVFSRGISDADEPPIAVRDLTYAVKGRAVLEHVSFEVPEGSVVGEYHIDTMRTLPAGAVLLASSRDCAHQAWRIGTRAWALQFHPEIDTAIMKSWIDDDREAVRQRGFEPDDVIDDFDRRSTDLVSTWRPFAHRFADIVRASVVPSAVTV